MKTRIVHTKIWQDEWFCNLPRASRLVFLYLLTCPQNNICGKFELPDRTIIFDTGVSRDELEQSKKDLESRAVFYMGWVRLIHTDKYNNYVNNPKLEIALKREIELIPEEINRVLNEYDTSMDTSIYTPNNHKSEIINNKSVIERGVGRDSLGDKDFEEIASRYGVPVSFVRSKYEDVCNWEDEKPGRMRGRNWRLTLINWVKRDAIKIKQGGMYADKKRGIDATGV